MEKSEILTVEKKSPEAGQWGEIRARKFQFLVDLTFIGTSWNLCVFQCGQVALCCFALHCSLVADEEGLCSIFLEILEKFHASSSSG